MKAGSVKNPMLKSLLQSESSRTGLSLVEILVAVLVLGILAIGGGALVNRGQIDMGFQKYKRAAIEAANSRMEEVVWSNPNRVSVVGTTNYNVSLNGINGFAMTTTVESLGTNKDNCFKITVNVEYVKNGASVQLETYRSN